jgi:AcrR family transcriptional regulator
MAQLVPKVPVEACTGPRGACDPRIERTRAAVLAAARDLFAEGGWDAVTHVAVAERSGVGRTTLYRHWPEASSLIREVLADDVAARSPAPTGDLRRDLVAQLEVFRERLQDEACTRSMVTIMERAAVDSDFAELRRAVTAACSQPMAEILARARADGRLPRALDLEAAVDQLSGPLAFRRLFARRSVTPQFVEQVVDDFLAAHRTRRSR